MIALFKQMLDAGYWIFRNALTVKSKILSTQKSQAQNQEKILSIGVTVYEPSKHFSELLLPS